MLCKLLARPFVSKVTGAFLSTPLSTLLINRFVEKNQIDMSQFETVRYRSYNEFFSRKIKEGQRPIDPDPRYMISPCDSKLTVYDITESGRFQIKHTMYTMAALIRNYELAEKYYGGKALIFRLTVDDYHRYCYVADGRESGAIHISGIFHTVNPVANDHYPIYKENTREYSILKTKDFGDILQMEVGAMLVGKIVNDRKAPDVLKGQEKGHFEFGGSTVALFFEPGVLKIDDDILTNSGKNVETIVKYGEKIGETLR